MRWMHVLTASAVVLLAAVVIGCGDSGPTAEEKREAAEQKEKAEEKKEEAVAKAEADKCQGQVGDFLLSLEELEARLEVGLNYDEYFEEVGNVQVAYNRIPINQMDEGCLTLVGVPSENAFNAYREAANIWEDCFEELSCETSNIDPEIQQEWAKASRLRVRAQQGLSAMRSI